MRKIKFVLEEVISQTFEIEVPEGVDVYKYIREQYKNEDIIINDPTLTQVNVMIHDEDGEGDWIDLHVS